MGNELYLYVIVFLIGVILGLLANRDRHNFL
jgi:hypothetical protein